jgi:glycosyltransferase involved in cell wall biosynthesis
LIIAGITSSEEYKEKIIEEAKKISVENRLVFTGAISDNDKQWYLQNCEAFLFPSLAEGFGLPVIEAMQYGVPVILSTSTALPEIGGEDAYYFSNFNPVSMQNDLVEFLNDYKNNPEKKQRIINRSKQFDWNTVAKKYLDVYRSFY